MYVSVATVNFDPDDGRKQRFRNAFSNCDRPSFLCISLSWKFKIKPLSTRDAAAAKIFIHPILRVTSLD